MRKLSVLLIVLFVLTLSVGCSSPQEEAAPEVVWDTLPVEEQGIEVTVTETAREHMANDWEAKSSNTALFMLIPGSS